MTTRTHSKTSTTRPKRRVEVALTEAPQGFFARLDTRFAARPDAPALSCSEDGVWRSVTYAELRERTLSVACELRRRGHGAGEHVAILATPSPEWGMAFLGSLRAGGVVVPLDPKLEHGELRAILEDARPGVLFVSPEEHERALQLSEQVASIWEVVVLSPGLDAFDAESPAGGDGPRSEVPGDRSPHEIALITYTSGTTGEPKGVMTTFGNLAHQANALATTLPRAKHDRLLSILPLNHMFELVGGFLSILWSGGEVSYGTSHYPDEVLSNLRERRITRMLCVPLFLELIKRRIEKELQRQPARKRLLHAAAYHVLGRLPLPRLKRLLFRPVHRALGGSLRYFISGGAPLERGTERFFERLGIRVYQGYGLTETSPVIAVNSPRHARSGSVGRTLPGVEVRIDEPRADGTGEILTRGPHVMEGYRGRPDLTRAAIDEDGWFHTGDLGRVDADGFLFVTGRKKSLIVLGSGKKVQPEEVEACLARCPAVAEACVVGLAGTEGLSRDHEKVLAVVVPAAGHSQEAVLAEVQSGARALAGYKRPSSVVLRTEALPRTSTAKVRRNEVRQWAAIQRGIAS